MAITKAQAQKRLQKWLDDTPRYQGDDPRSVHYKENREALEMAIALLAEPTITVTISNAAVDAAVTSRKHQLITDIIGAYHTTRLSQTSVSSHILSKPNVQKSFDGFERLIRQTDELPDDDKKGRTWEEVVRG